MKYFEKFNDDTGKKIEFFLIGVCLGGLASVIIVTICMCLAN